MYDNQRFRCIDLHSWEQLAHKAVFDDLLTINYIWIIRGLSYAAWFLPLHTSGKWMTCEHISQPTITTAPMKSTSASHREIHPEIGLYSDFNLKLWSPAFWSHITWRFAVSTGVLANSPAITASMTHLSNRSTALPSPQLRDAQCLASNLSQLFPIPFPPDPQNLAAL